MSSMLRKLLSRGYWAEEGEGSSGGGAPAPAEATSESTDNAPVDWEAMNEGIAPGVDDESDGGDTPQAAAAPAKPEVKPPAETTTTGEATGEGKPEGDGKSAEDLPPEDEPPPEQTLTPEQQAAREKELNERFKEWQTGEMARLAKDVYAFDEETAQRLQTEPELVLPQLAARLELNATQRALEAVQRLIPQLVQPVVQGQEIEKKADQFFFDKNPDLKKYKAQVLKAGAMFRELNPKATPDEAAEQIGAIVRATLKLKPLAAAAPAPASGKPAPHKPAGAGSAPAPRTEPKADQSVWDDLSRDDD